MSAFFGSITWPPISQKPGHLFCVYKSSFLELFECTIFRGWCKISIWKVVVKKKVFRKWVVHFFGGAEGLGDCYCMMLLGALEGSSKIL